MAERAEALAAELREVLGEAIEGCTVRLGEVTLEVAPERVPETGRRLREALGFHQLVDLCGVDYGAYGRAEWDAHTERRGGFSRGARRDGAGFAERQARFPGRFAVVYHLLSHEHNRRLRMRAFCRDDDFPRMPSVVDVWPSANWYEREAFDLYGIVFEGHPDLRRILTDYGFVGHPFRKDFPLWGHVEMRYDAEKGRVVYEPVSIEPRILVPRVIRHDARYVGRGRAAGEGGEG
ncbi:NADH-quinone oxidoreductase subunit C [Inmirania thermothiophila]|uniref:NADH-quinone oxidoreductase subunit C n=1 Tax=Inmirania thermothiophila TaxID=1750597 RepID=A0A3N1Y0A1_9GAMM|nr:NADH-quinone oxidoreductase subunit C [Inmirania thermothiophila]ROR32273.1 NADH-quinone oxidoreductase subunit C [Inmirania thermothiophila]